MSAHITLNDVTIDPHGERRSRDAANTEYIYIRTKAPLLIPEQATLKEIGVQFLERLEPTVYLCKYAHPNSDLEVIRGYDFIEAVNCYHNVLKTGPRLYRAFANLAEDHSKHPVNLVLHADITDSGPIAERIKGIDGVDANSVQGLDSVIMATASRKAVEKIREIDGVRSVVPETPMSVGNDKAVEDLHATSFTKIAQTLDGSGQTILINDSGFDKGDLTDVHPAFADRIAELTSCWPNAITYDKLGHGTHVAGSVAGLGESASMGGVIPGSAPASRLLIQSLYDASANFRPLTSYVSLLQRAYDAGVRISNNSWGQNWNAIPYQQMYGVAVTDSTVDKFIWNNQDMVVIISAGNDGRQSNGAQITAAAAAKNCITVGATYSSRESTTDDFKYIPDRNTHQNSSTIAPFSSRGPTIDGRVKPDVVAPGVAILSACSRHPDFLASGKVNSYGTSADPLYRFSSGTSMAAPLVTGCCALIRQLLLDAGYTRPSAALVKALLINGSLACDETHEDRSNSQVKPDGAFGWGRVDMEHAIFLPGKTLNGEFLDDVQGLKFGAAREISCDNEGVKSNLKVTLVWSDPPGAILNHPLGLSVYDDTDPTKPTLLGCGYDATLPQPINNVQQIILHNVKADAKLRIHIGADWPFTDNDVAQPFAVVWSLYD